MKKIILSLLLAATGALPGWSVQPRVRTTQVRQSDGTTLTVTRVYRQQMLLHMTTDGLALGRSASGDLCYMVERGGRPAVGNTPAHDPSARSPQEQAYAADSVLTVAQVWQLASPQPAPTRAGRALIGLPPGRNGLGVYGQSGGGVVNSIGRPVIPLVLVQFADKQLQPTTTVESVDRIFNQKSYADVYGSVGSVRDYFSDNSYGAFEPVFEVLGPVTVANDESYYGRDQGYSVDRNARLLPQDAMRVLLQDGRIDLARYADADGRIPLMAICFAGVSQESAPDAPAYTDLVWAHFAQLGGVSVTQNGKSYTLGSYFVGSELWYDNQMVNLQPSGIGVFVHEFLHALGLPDFYDTANNVSGSSSVVGMAWWSVLCNGEWYGNGYAPTGMTAYERCVLGWLDVETLGSEAQWRNLTPLHEASGARAYRLVNDMQGNDYYILENRQPSRWFPSAFGRGMLVTHVDYSASAWANNTVNTSAAHERMTFVPADNQKRPLSGLTYQNTEIAGDLYPGTSGNRELSDESAPSTLDNVYYGGHMPSIYNITQQADGGVSFSYLDRSATGLGASPRAGGVPLSVYTVEGRLVGRSADGCLERMHLSPGTYIISGAGVHRKVVIP